MKIVFIIGNAAVGKMTVGQELMNITDLRLFHNHMTIEPVVEIFGYFDRRTISRLRDVIFEEFAASAAYGLIFTYMWAFDQQEDWDYIAHVQELFQSSSPEFYFVELTAAQEIRLQRNVTENRLRQKATKRSLTMSQERLLSADRHYRLESLPGEIPFQNYLKIDNSDIPPNIVAQKIKTLFNL